MQGTLKSAEVNCCTGEISSIQIMADDSAQPIAGGVYKHGGFLEDCGESIAAKEEL
jgi:hypothetical protein